MFACPVVVVDPEGQFNFFDGTLFRLIPELSGRSKINRYAALKKAGWHEIDYGFHAFVCHQEDGGRYIFAGINVTDSKAKKDFGISPVFSKRQFENFVDELREREDAHRVKAETDINLLVHDLRRLSTSIYHAAEAAKTHLRDREFDSVLNRIENIIASQGMLRIRTDVLDFSGNPNAHQTNDAVPIFRRIDKVVKCFQPIAAKKRISIVLRGPSFAEAHGPNVFEIVPYIIIDNAVKYAPWNSQVEVTIRDLADDIVAEFKSLGPFISAGEQERVFTRGFRGAAARSMDRSGSGIGLYLAKSLIQQFGGSISVSVSDKEIESSSGVLHDVNFIVSVPVYSRHP